MKSHPADNSIDVILSAAGRIEITYIHSIVRARYRSGRKGLKSDLLSIQYHIMSNPSSNSQTSSPFIQVYSANIGLVEGARKGPTSHIYNVISK